MTTKVKKRPKKTFIGVQFPKETYALIERLSENSGGRSMASVVREIVHKHFAS